MHVLVKRNRSMIVVIDSPRPVDSTWRITDRVPDPEAVRIRFTFRDLRDRRRCGCPHAASNPVVQGDDQMSQISITNLQRITATAGFLDAAGQPAQIDGLPNWQSTNETFVTVAPNGNECVISSTGLITPEPVLVTCTADARIGADVREIVGVIEVSVTQDERTEAMSVNFTFGQPEDR